MTACDCTARHTCSCWKLLTVTLRSLLKSESWSSSARLVLTSQMSFRLLLRADWKLTSNCVTSREWFVAMSRAAWLNRRGLPPVYLWHAPALAVGAPQCPSLPPSPRWLPQLMKAVADSSAGLNSRINSLFEQISPPKLEGPASADVSQVNTASTSKQQCLEITKPTRNEKQNKTEKLLTWTTNASKSCSFVPSQLQHFVFHLNWDVHILPPYL